MRLRSFARDLRSVSGTGPSPHEPPIAPAGERSLPLRVLEALPDPVAVVDAGGRLLLVNAAFARAVGSRIDDVAGLPFADVVRGRDLGTPAVLPLPDDPDRATVRIFPPPPAAPAAPHRDVEVFRRVAAGVAHDLNNVFSVVTALGDLALAQAHTGDVGRADLTEIVRAAKRGIAVTRQLSVLAAPVAREPVEVPLGEALRSNEKMLGRLLPPGVALEIEAGAGAGPRVAAADPRDVVRLLLNLAVVLDDVPGLETSRWRALTRSLAEPAEGVFGPVPAGEWAVIEVDLSPPDGSAALRAALTAQVGDASTPGASAVRAALDRMAGGLRLVEGGVRVFLPGVGDPTGDRAEPVRSGPAATVLLVEGDPALRGTLRRGLSGRGLDPFDAGEASEAEALLAGGFRPSAVVLGPGVGPAAARELVERLGGDDAPPTLTFGSAGPRWIGGASPPSALASAVEGALHPHDEEDR